MRENMPIKIQELSIPDIKLITPTKFKDDRGFFLETYNNLDFKDAGFPNFVQDNLSESSIGVIRGMHWQADPFAQGKLVTCISGAIVDVVVDVRKDSPTFRKYILIELNENSGSSIWVPAGFAHGFQALANKTRVLYKVTEFWNKESERSFNPLDTNINIPWPLDANILSKKDAEAPEFPI